MVKVTTLKRLLFCSFGLVTNAYTIDGFKHSWSTYYTHERAKNQFD